VHYDPMVAKLIVWAPDRSTCIDRTIAAVDDYHLAGFKTTLPFCRLVLDSAPFRTGAYSTFYVKEHWPIDLPASWRELVAGVAASAFAQEQQRRSPVTP
jgi:acetyl/propionyl-CoA carboxylase alpha subunit